MAEKAYICYYRFALNIFYSSQDMKDQAEQKPMFSPLHDTR